MATTFPTYPATTFEQAVELAIFSSNQLHNIINADATSVIETEDGNIPSIRYALTDNLYFKTPAIDWEEGLSVTVFNQLYTFSGGTTGTALWYAPTATASNPITTGTSPEDDDNWRLYGWDTYSKKELNSTSGASYIGTSDGSNVDEKLTSSLQFVGSYEEGLITISSLNDLIEYNAIRYYVSPSANIPFITTGVTSSSWENDKGNFLPIGETLLRKDLTTLGDNTAANMIPLTQGGYIQDAICDIYVDAFEADPTGTNDSTDAVLAAIAAVGGPTDSAYVPSTTKYANIIFGNGKYVVGDIPFISGVTFKGQGKLQTQIIPKAGASYCFSVSGVSDYYADTSSWDTIKRCMNAGIENLSIMPYSFGQSGSIVTGVGGVNISYASYFRMINVSMDNLGGIGLNQEQLWDSDFTDVRITSCGKDSTDDNIIPSFYLGMGTTISVDGSNAIRYRGLHLENSPRLMYVDRYSRHIFFTSPKIEGTSSSYSSIIDGAYGVVYNCAELTWQYSDKPMFDILRTTDSRDSRGVIFQTPICISSPTTSKHGWYFRHSSNYGALQLNNIHCEYVKTLVTGTNVLVNGGTTWQCGPNFATGTAYFAVKDTINRSIIPGSATDGTEDFISVSGGGIQILNNSFGAIGGSVSNGISYLNIASVTSAAVITGNIFTGVTQYGLRQTTNYQDVLVSDNMATVTLGSISSLGYDSKQVSELLDTGSIVTDGVFTSKISVSRCSVLRLIFTASDRQTSAVVQLDSATSHAVVMATNGTSGIGRVKDGGSSTGTSGDGYMYIRRNDTGFIEVTNRTGVSGTISLKCVM